MDPNAKWYPGIEGIFSCPSYPAPQQNGQYGVHYDLFADFWNCCTASSQLDARHRVASLAIIDTSADKVILAETGVNDATWGWPFFGTWQWDWADSVGNPRGSTDNARIALERDCDYAPRGNGTWAGCGMLPRYRHNRVANVVFADGPKAWHAAKSSGSATSMCRTACLDSGLLKGGIRTKHHFWGQLYLPPQL